MLTSVRKGFGNPSTSALVPTVAVSVWPTCAVPVIPGLPVAAVLAGRAMITDTLLVSVSALLASSVKLTLTLIVVPRSAVTGV